jgi:hypothetical protein
MKCGKSRPNLFGKNFAAWFDGKFGIMSRVISGDLVPPIPVPGSVNADILSLELKLTPRAFPAIFD